LYSVVMLVMKGGGQMLTKHLCTRMNLGKEMVDEARAKVIYFKARDMQADGFSKLYDLVKHKPFPRLILGEGLNAVQVGVER
jgi:hypothetical protein